MRWEGPGKAQTLEGLESHLKTVGRYSNTVGRLPGGFRQGHRQNLILHISNGPLSALFCAGVDPLTGRDA